MKRYIVINNQRNITSKYSTLQWELAWKIVFVLGIFTGYLIGKI